MNEHHQSVQIISLCPTSSISKVQPAVIQPEVCHAVFQTVKKKERRRLLIFVVLDLDLWLYLISKVYILSNVDYILSHVNYIIHIPIKVSSNFY